ncbi:cellobiose phosphorylase Cbp94B [Butyrivibrio proteoclasticus B316]|uniref:Cellobiose phosphorylase Cbp94B n=1 Tax=Butyrivibrio proteoclasticus (strain ATCC 51982 / DSM 14932 / B316) TaxID=515622 RepID=E0S356_BUTPB|nr:cellobiose phosphorylase [Butyrivibrio proteoclasticus]ADL35838.1 cellobiose phosphorylase Cbp94B [Butyrivibrio proteoclasticus B316]
MIMKNIGKIEFIDNKGSFKVEKPENTSYLYYPIAGEKGLKGCVTPKLGGDLMVDQETFILEPVSVENLHNNRNTRNFWLCMDDGKVWSATGSSAEQENNKFTDKQDDSLVTAGFMWHKAIRSNNEAGLTAEVTSFVPVNTNVEIMSVTIRNDSPKAKTIVPVAAIPIFGRSADNLRDHRNVTSMLHRISIIPEGILVKPTMSFDEKGHRVNHKTYYVLGFDENGHEPESFYPTVEAFIGEGGSFLKPRSVYCQKPSFKAGTEIAGMEAVGGLRFEKCVLTPGQEATYTVLIGVADNNEEIEDISKLYRDNKNVEKELTYTRDYWRNKVNVNFHTQDKAFDQFMQWIAFQPLLRRVYGCSFLPYHDYGRGGRGWRDLWQDCLSLLFMEPGEVRNMIVANFGGVRMDGTNATIIGEGLGNFIADRNGIARVWMDHAFWPLRTLLLYIEQSGDYDILIEQVPYFKDSIVHRGNLIDKKFENAENKQLVNSDNKEMVYEGTILEHLLIQNLTSYYEVGEHNVLRLRGADWNDALDMANENGESVAFSYAYAGNLRELAKLIRKFSARCKVNAIFVASEIAALLDHAQTTEEKTRLLAAYMKTVEGNLCGEQIAIELSELANKLESLAESFTEHLKNQEWIKGSRGTGWFNSYYDNSKRAVERYDEDDEKTRMMLTGQVFAIMGDVASDDQIKKITKAADKYLYKESIGGYRLNTDFHEFKTDMGRMFGFAYGEKENGAVFSHMAVMYGNALYGRGFAKEGFKALNTLYQASMNYATSHIYPGIPEYFSADGRGKYPYLTGAASWYLLTMITEVFGVRGQAGNLSIEPALLASQFDKEGRAGISLNFAGKRFDITIENPENLEAGTYKIKAASLNGSGIGLEEGRLVIPREIIDKLGSQNEVIVRVE